MIYARRFVALTMLTAVIEAAPEARVTMVKSVSFRYTTTGELSSVFENFRLMCNDAIRIAFEEKPASRFSLIELAYSRLAQYGLHTHYILSACEVAHSVYKNRNRKSVPYVKRAFLKLDNQSYRLNHLLLRIPTTPRHYVFLVLHGSTYHASFMDDSSLRRGSVTITGQTVSVAFSKRVVQVEPSGYIGVDINERNVTISATDGSFKQFTELKEIAEIKERCKAIRAKIGRTTGRDNRVSKQLLAKYGERERNRTAQRIHRVTRRIVEYAELHQLGIKMEKLTGIRKCYRRGNGHGTFFRGRMNSWVFGEAQRQTGYKAKWDGIPVYYINPRGTSRNCPDCGSRVVPLAERRLYCPKCDRIWDRDVLASKNVMACAVPQDRPSKRSREGERGDDGSNPPSRWREVGSDGLPSKVESAEPKASAAISLLKLRPPLSSLK